jgi:hypothetical protein
VGGGVTLDAAAENAQELKQALLEQGVGYLRELVQSLVDEA